MTVLRVNEKSLTRRYTTMLEMGQHLRKDNNKLRDDFTAMQVAVTERIGYLQRYKVHVNREMAYVSIVRRWVYLIVAAGIEGISSIHYRLPFTNTMCILDNVCVHVVLS